MKSNRRSLPNVELIAAPGNPAINDWPLAKILSWRNHPDIFKWCRQYEQVSWSHHEEYWKRVVNDSSCKMYGIYSDKTLIGVCGLTSIDWINRRAEFSLYINPTEHGSGFGESALRALCRHGFDVLNLNCIWGEAFAGNPAIKMFHRVGFKSEGARRGFYYRQGKYVDAVLFSLLRDEWN